MGSGSGGRRLHAFGSLMGNKALVRVLAVRQPRLRLMLALLTAEAVVLGALELLIVIVAVSVLGRLRRTAGAAKAQRDRPRLTPRSAVTY